MVDCGCAFCTGDLDSTEDHFEGFLHYPEYHGGKEVSFPVMFFAVLTILALVGIGVTFA